MTTFAQGPAGLLPELRWRGMFHAASDGLEARLASGRPIAGYNGFDPSGPWLHIGHLVPAKKFGVKVTQYMVGFGPTLWSTRRGETEYGIKAIVQPGGSRRDDEVSAAANEHGMTMVFTGMRHFRH